MKTAKEHFESLDEPYRSQALENCYPELINMEFRKASNALFSCFSWAKSKQGYEYWDKLDDILYNSHK